MANEQEAQRAAENLAKKTKMPWLHTKRAQENSDFIIYLKTASPTDDSLTFSSRFKAMGIDITPSITHTEKKAADDFMLTLTISHPLAIKSIAKNEFKYPDITHTKCTHASEQLKPFLQSLPNHVTVSIIASFLTLKTKMAARSEEYAAELMKEALRKTKVITDVKISTSMKGLAKGYVNVLAEIRNPLEIEALAHLSQQTKNDKSLSGHKAESAKNREIISHVVTLIKAHSAEGRSSDPTIDTILRLAEKTLSNSIEISNDDYNALTYHVTQALRGKTVSTSGWLMSLTDRSDATNLYKLIQQSLLRKMALEPTTSPATPKPRSR